MHRIRRLLGISGAVAAVMLAFSVSAANAQSVAASEAQAFLGKWTIALEAPQGGFGGGGGGGGGFRGAGGGGGGGGGAGARGPMVLEITDAEGQLKANLTGGMGGPQSISRITKSGDALVLSYQASLGGQSAPVTLRLTPDGEKLKTSMDIAGMINLDGTATKE